MLTLGQSIALQWPLNFQVTETVTGLSLPIKKQKQKQKQKLVIIKLSEEGMSKAK